MFPFRRLGGLVAATTATCLALSGAPLAAAAEADQVRVSVANITDFHGRLEPNFSKDATSGELRPKSGDEMGAANIAGIINYLRSQNPNTVVTTSGDNQGGSAFVSAISDDEYTMRFLNELDANGSAVGNHEFDKGYQDLLDRIVPGTRDKQLGANIFKQDGTRDVKPYEIVEFDGVRVALVGTTSNLTVTKSNPANVAGLDIRDSAEQVNAEARRLKDAEEAEVVIALVHDDAATTAPKLDPGYVDFLFGGDSHLRVVEEDASVPYAQSHEYGKAVTDLDFTYDKTTGEIVSSAFRQYDAADLAGLQIEPDSTVAGIVAEAKEVADVLGSEVVAATTSSFVRGSNPGAAPGSNRGTESTANNMIAQSAVQSLEAFLGRDIDFGIMNAGGVRADIGAGDITYKQAFEVQPFGNDISLATVSGAVIKEMLENQWQTSEQEAKSGRPRLDLGLSDNVSYTYDPDAPRGEKILSITLDGEPIRAEQEYTVAASSFLLDGGDGFIDPAKVASRNDVGYNDLQAFIDYLKTGAAAVRSAQKDVGVVLPAGGLQAGEANEIALTSLSYSSEGEPLAQNVTVALEGGATRAEATAVVNNEVSDADKGYGERGRATVTVDLPADAAGARELEITTDAGTKVRLPLTVSSPDPVNDPAPADPSEGSSVDGLTGLLARVLALLGLLDISRLLSLPVGQQLSRIFDLGAGEVH